MNIRNDEGHTALDVVNLFTSSKASADIKQLLKGLFVTLILRVRHGKLLDCKWLRESKFTADFNLHAYQ